MKRNNLKKLSILIGVMSFAFGSLCAYVAYKTQSKGRVQEVVEQAPSVSPVQEAVIPVIAPVAEVKPASSGIDLRKVVDEAKKSYSTAEKSAKEGLLWIDKETEKNVITLGAINGLVKGSELSVSQNGKSVGKVRVEILFDSISYVVPVDPNMTFVPKVYYKVNIE